MSVQTILHKSFKSLLDDAVTSTINNTEKLMTYKRFKLGTGHDKKQQIKDSLMIEMGQLKNCELINYVENIIENGPEMCPENK